MDALSEVLKTIRLTGAIFIEAEMREPWSFQTPPPRAIADALMPEADHVIPYHLITMGGGAVRLPDGQTAALHPGDLIIFPHGDSHILCSTGALSPQNLTAAEISRILYRGKITPVRRGGDGSPTGLVCGFFACDKQLSEPMLSGLPPMIRINLEGDPGGAWLKSTVRHSVAEAAKPKPGAATVLAKLSELLFVEAIRRYVEQVPANQVGWIAGLRDIHVAKALGLLHGKPEHPWTVEKLAREIGQSRSVFAERFAHFLGQPPLQYLTRWRMVLAADQLRSGKASIGRVAEHVGYESEAAFTRAFKRHFGLPPATWRRQTVRERHD